MLLSEAERKKLINRLKTVKDATERDRIIWALAGQEPKSEEAGPSPMAASGARQPPVNRCRETRAICRRSPSTPSA